MPTTGTLQAILALLLNDTILIDGVIAEITRQAYYNQYNTWINTGQFVPILNYNIESQTIGIIDTDSLSFTGNDIFTANDWFVVNANTN